MIGWLARNAEMIRAYDAMTPCGALAPWRLRLERPRKAREGSVWR